MSINSVSRVHFPVVRYVGGHRRLFHPLLRKNYADRPEERVRLAWIDYLLFHRLWPGSRIHSEGLVSSKKEETSLRFDLLLYNQQFKPHVLVECKAPSVTLSEETALQIGRYNRQLDVPYLLLTNGRHDLFFDLREGKPRLVEKLPEWLCAKESSQRDYIYWKERGFLSSTLEVKRRPQALTLLNQYLGDSQSDSGRVGIFEFNEFHFRHPFFFLKDQSFDVAVTLVATYSGDNLLYLRAKNASGKTCEVAVVLDLLSSSEKNAWVNDGNKPNWINAAKHLPYDQPLVNGIYSLLTDIFSHVSPSS